MTPGGFERDQSDSKVARPRPAGPLAVRRRLHVKTVFLSIISSYGDHLDLHCGKIRTGRPELARELAAEPVALGCIRHGVHESIARLFREFARRTAQLGEIGPGGGRVPGFFQSPKISISP